MGANTRQIAARRRAYVIIRLLIAALYGVAIVTLLCGLSLGTYLWFCAEALKDGRAVRGPLEEVISGLDSSQLVLSAGVSAVVGVVGFLILGAFGQLLAMQRDRSINAALQVQLLEDILELNEADASATRLSRIDLCEGCGRLGALQAIESGQWICRECRRQLHEN